MQQQLWKLTEFPLRVVAVQNYDELRVESVGCGVWSVELGACIINKLAAPVGSVASLINVLPACAVEVATLDGGQREGDCNCTALHTLARSVILRTALPPGRQIAYITSKSL